MLDILEPNVLDHLMIIPLLNILSHSLLRIHADLIEAKSKFFISKSKVRRVLLKLSFEAVLLNLIYWSINL